MKILTNKTIRKIVDKLFDLKDICLDQIDEDDIDVNKLDEMMDIHIELCELVGGNVAIDYSINKLEDRIIKSIAEELKNGE